MVVRLSGRRTTVTPSMGRLDFISVIVPEIARVCAKAGSVARELKKINLFIRLPELRDPSIKRKDIFWNTGRYLKARFMKIPIIFL
jgi:hypothetical protein